MLFHWLLHCAIVQNSSKGLETICTWTFATSVLRQPRTWESRVGAAALLWCQGGAGSWSFPSSVRSSGQQGLIHVELLGSMNRGSHHCSQSLLGLVQLWAQRKSFISAPSHAGRNTLPNLFHTGALAIPQMLFIKQAALDGTAESSVAASDWGDPFCLNAGFSLLGSQCQASCPQEVKHSATSAFSQHFLIKLKTIGFLKCCCLVSISLSACN